MTFTRIPRLPGERDHYRDVRCSDCDTPLTPVFCAPDLPTGEWDSLQADTALHLTLSGGYGMFIDSGFLDQDEADQLEVLLCVDCAKKLCQAFPYLERAVSVCIDGSTGHHCTDGSFRWIGSSDCPDDPDLHGWREVFSVSTPGALLPTTSGIRRRTIHVVTNTRAEADDWVTLHPGPDYHIFATPIGNVPDNLRPTLPA